MAEFPKKYARRRKNRYSLTYDWLNDEAQSAFFELIDIFEEATSDVAIQIIEVEAKMHPMGHGWCKPVARALNPSESEMSIAVSAYGVTVMPVDGRNNDPSDYTISWAVLSPLLKRTPEEYAMAIMSSAIEEVRGDPLATFSPSNQVMVAREFLGFELRHAEYEIRIPTVPAVIFPTAGVYAEIRALGEL